MKFRLLTLFIILFSFTACVPSGGTQTETVSADSTPTNDSSLPLGDISSTPIITSEQVTPGQSLPTASATSTRDVSNIDWREVPIMPEISDRIYQIYRDGQQQGRDSHSFSVIGDCQSIPYVFLGPYGRGTLEPDAAESHLWDALDYFADSFDHWSVTSRGGFTAASILAPIQADPHYCKPGETPLTCEYRLNNPAYVFITLETWLPPTPIDRYEVYLRAILDYVIEHGSVPILLTKADAVETDDGHQVINPAIVRVALEYDVPVVNFWRAAQYLDNFGIDPAREGFHLSKEGYKLKNTLALRALYSIWQAVEGGVSSGTGTPSAGFTPTPAPGEPLDVDSQITVPDCTGSCVFFATAISKDGVVSSGGVYAYNYTAQALIQVLGPGFDLQDVSEDGRRLLVNQEKYLYEVDLSDSSATLLSNSFFSLGKQGAYWNSDDSTVILIDSSHPFQTDTGSAITLYPSSRDDEIVFESGTCASKDFCQSNGVYRLDADQNLSFMDGYARPVFTPDGRLMAFLNPDAAVQDNYFHIGYLLMEDPDRSALTRRIFYFPAEHGFMIYPDVREYAFSPDNNRLMIIYDVYSAYFEKSQRLQTYLMDLTTNTLLDFGKMTGISASLTPRLAWSPQSDKILFFLTSSPEDNQFSISIYQTDLKTGEKLTLYDESVMTDSDYFYITNLYWR